MQSRGVAVELFRSLEVVEKMAEPMGFESTSDMETNEFCGAPWPSKELKRKKRNS
jgi:hypothetical protein